MNYREELQRRTEVQQAFLDGKEIEVKLIDSDIWNPVDVTPIWDWESCDYRIKLIKTYEIRRFLKCSDCKAKIQLSQVLAREASLSPPSKEIYNLSNYNHSGVSRIYEEELNPIKEVGDEIIRYLITYSRGYFDNEIDDCLGVIEELKTCNKFQISFQSQNNVKVAAVSFFKTLIQCWIAEHSHLAATSVDEIFDYCKSQTILDKTPETPAELEVLFFEL